MPLRERLKKAHENRMTEPFPNEVDFSTKFLQDKNWKIFRKSIIVNGISFKLKDLAKLPLNQRLDFTQHLFIVLNKMNDKKGREGKYER